MSRILSIPSVENSLRVFADVDDRTDQPRRHLGKRKFPSADAGAPQFILVGWARVDGALAVAYPAVADRSRHPWTLSYTPAKRPVYGKPVDAVTTGLAVDGAWVVKRLLGPTLDAIGDDLNKRTLRRAPQDQRSRRRKGGRPERRQKHELARGPGRFMERRVLGKRILHGVLREPTGGFA